MKRLLTVIAFGVTCAYWVQYNHNRFRTQYRRTGSHPATMAERLAQKDFEARLLIDRAFTARNGAAPDWGPRR